MKIGASCSDKVTSPTRYYRRSEVGVNREVRDTEALSAAIVTGAKEAGGWQPVMILEQDLTSVALAKPWGVG